MDNNWSREELVVALNLYWKIPYNKISGSNNDLIKKISSKIMRTPSALAFKLMNFTSLDNERQSKGNKGKSSYSKLDKVIWDEYYFEWEKLAYDSELILLKFQNVQIENKYNSDEEISNYSGNEKERLVRTRINQNDFRKRVLASYNEKCCITGINIAPLLVASHIIPWSINQSERLNPRNGICFNSFHDKAFDKGYITITENYKIKVSKIIKENLLVDFKHDFFFKYDDKEIILPDRFLPSKEFIEFHNKNIFING